MSVHSARTPNGPPSDERSGWPFFPSYNPLDDVSPPAEVSPRRKRLAAEVKRIVVGALWRTALFGVAAEALYFLFVARGWLAEVIG